AAGRVLTAALLAAPWGALPAEGGTLVDLARRRWPAASFRPLIVATIASAFLFIWAQLAALVELSRTLGWPRPAAVAVAVAALALAAWLADGRAPAAVLRGARGAAGSAVSSVRA